MKTKDRNRPPNGFSGLGLNEIGVSRIFFSSRISFCRSRGPETYRRVQTTHKTSTPHPRNPHRVPAQSKLNEICRVRCEWCPLHNTFITNTIRSACCKYTYTYRYNRILKPTQKKRHRRLRIMSVCMGSARATAVAYAWRRASAKTERTGTPPPTSPSRRWSHNPCCTPSRETCTCRILSSRLGSCRSGGTHASCS